MTKGIIQSLIMKTASDPVGFIGLFYFIDLVKSLQHYG